MMVGSPRKSCLSFYMMEQREMIRWSKGQGFSFIPPLFHYRPPTPPIAWGFSAKINRPTQCGHGPLL